VLCHGESATCWTSTFTAVYDLLHQVTFKLVRRNAGQHLVIEDNDEHHFDFGVHVECFLLHKVVARKISIVMAALNFWVINSDHVS
jgi:hypothetical protein